MSDNYLHRWAADPDGGGRFPGRRDRLLAHDQTCSSLRHAWYPRTRSVVCPSDLSICEGCSVDFFLEGLGLYETATGDLELCACCAKKRGLT